MARVTSIENFRGSHYRITFENISVNDIRWRNFSGIAAGMNRPGDRNFKLVIDEESVPQLANLGMHVALKESSKANSPATYQIKVNVSFRIVAPYIVLRSGNNVVRLNEETVNELDHAELIDIRRLVVTTSSNTFNSNETAYIEDAEFVKRENRFRDLLDQELNAYSEPDPNEVY